jgi:hypothetical protein
MTRIIFRYILIFGLLLLPLFAWAQDFSKQFPYHKKTEYFDFYYLRETPKISEFARFADGFVKLVNRDFFKADFDYPIRVLVFENKEQFQQFAIERLHMTNPPGFGFYNYDFKFFATYDGSGLGTFSHEILHPLVERDLKERPQWAMEGIPTFFEKFYGYWKGDELVVCWGYQNPWRIQQLGNNLSQLDLKEIASDLHDFSWQEQNESSCRMVSVFLWQQGRFKRFLNLIANHDKAGYPTYLEAAMKMPMGKILPLWQAYLDDVAVHRAKNLSLPVSQIFEDEAAFESFVKTNEISIRQPEKSD